jgi:transcriptional regulator with XRE-family HTH domain
MTPDQIRAARALKNWSQAELAERVNMATPSIGNIESGKHAASPQTQAAILETFKNAGIEFIDGGVRHVQDAIQVLEGKDCYLRLLDDVFHTLKDTKNPELLISCSDDRKSPSTVNDAYRRMRKAGIKMRQLIEEGNTYLMGDSKEYRYMPKSYFINRVLVIYGEKAALVLDNESKVLIFKDNVMAYVQRNIFDLLWETLPKATKSTADETF